MQERRETNKKAPARHKAEEEYLLSTKLFCGKCQRMMAGESGTSRENIVYRYYKCSGIKRKLGCDKKTVRKSWIEDIVVEEIKRLVHDDEAVAYIADCVMEVQGRENPILPCLREQLAEVEKGIGNLVNAIQMGICNDATKKRMEELEARKTELGIQIAKEELAKPIVTREQITCWLEHFRTFDTNKFEHRRRFIDTFVNRIFLYDDKMVITFNYNKGTKTITFAELEASGILSISNIASMGEPEKSKSKDLLFSSNPKDWYGIAIGVWQRGSAWILLRIDCVHPSGVIPYTLSRMIFALKCVWFCDIMISKGGAFVYGSKMMKAMRRNLYIRTRKYSDTVRYILGG